MTLSTEEWTLLKVFERHLAQIKLEETPIEVIQYFKEQISELKKRQ